MSSLFGSLEVGKKSLSASQQGQAVTGHNIANVDTEGFSRQSINQSAAKPNSDGRGQGVNVDGVRRIQDGFTKQKVVDEQTRVGTWNTRQQILGEAEIIYTDLEGNRLRGALDEFWGAWSSVANQPESSTMRKALVNKGVALAERFNLFSKRLSTLHDSINGRILGEVEEINQISREIAEVNTQVEQLEKRGRPANDQRDKRENLLQKLSEKVEIRSFENDRHTLEVQLVDGSPLVHGREAYDLIPRTRAENQGDFRLGLVSNSGVERDVTDVIKAGGLKELIDQREGNVAKWRGDIDAMARELAFQVNRLHGSGTGIKDVRKMETSAYSLNPEAIQQPLPYLQSGLLQFKLLDPEGMGTDMVSVEIEPGVDTIKTIIDKINTAAGAYEVDEQGNKTIKDPTPFAAKLNEDGSVSLEAGMGQSFIYAGDQTNLLAVLGFNNFFSVLDGAADIKVNEAIVQDEMKIAAGTDLVPGDNRIAMAITQLQHAATMNDGTISFDEFYNGQLTEVGLKMQEAQKGQKSHQEMLDQYEQLRDSVSAVNLDEEMANMVKYQRAYESSAKFLSTIDEMTQTVINM